MGAKRFILYAALFITLISCQGCNTSEQTLKQDTPVPTLTQTVQESVQQTMDLEPSKSLIPDPNSGLIAVFTVEGSKENGFKGYLLGGARASIWYETFDLPVTVDGEIIKKDEISKLGEKQKPVDSKMVIENQKYVVYNSLGKVADATDKLPLQIKYNENIGQALIVSDFTAKENVSDFGFCIAISSDHDAMPRPTNFSQTETGVVISADINSSGREVSMNYTKQENGLYTIEMIDSNGKHLIISDYEIEENGIEAFFLDVNNDGAMEFIENIKGANSYIAVSRISDYGIENLLRINTGM